MSPISCKYIFSFMSQAFGLLIIQANVNYKFVVCLSLSLLDSVVAFQMVLIETIKVSSTSLSQAWESFNALGRLDATSFRTNILIQQNGRNTRRHKRKFSPFKLFSTQNVMTKKRKSKNKPSLSPLIEAMRLISDIKNDHFEPINFIQVSCLEGEDDRSGVKTLYLFHRI